MNHYYHLFFGVPCCERFSRQTLEHLLSTSRYLQPARSIIHADRFVVVGKITHKQKPLLQYLWDKCAYPGLLIHLSGCDKALKSYSIISDLSQVVVPDHVLDSCIYDLEVIEELLKAKE